MASVVAPIFHHDRASVKEESTRCQGCIGSRYDPELGLIVGSWEAQLSAGKVSCRYICVDCPGTRVVRVSVD